MKKLDNLEEKIKNQVCNERDPNLQKNIDELLKTAIFNFRRLQ